MAETAEVAHTFPTAASPKSTSLTLLLGFAVLAPVDSDMAGEEPNGFQDLGNFKIRSSCRIG